MTTQQKIRTFMTDFASLKALLVICSITFFHNAVMADELQDAVNELAVRISKVNHTNPDLVADVELFHKSIVWALRYDSPLTPNDELVVKKALASGTRRAEALAANKTNWTTKKGKVLRGFVSAVDGSTQPYGVIVPKNYDGTKPMRLDVVLHGSSKPVGMSELRFGTRFDVDDEDDASAPDVDFIELHPLVAWRTATAGPVKRMSLKPLKRPVATTISTETASCSAACPWARPARGIWD